MNIRYNQLLRRFEVEFSTDFNGDLSAVKTAKFETDGPPTWTWHTAKISVLNRLRENRPPSGLTIAPEALVIYKPLAEIEAKNEEVKKQLATFRKTAKKAQKEASKCDWLPPGKEFLGAEDLPPMPPFISPYPTTKIEPIGVCRICEQPMYGWPDLGDICIWCEKQVDENKC